MESDKYGVLLEGSDVIVRWNQHYDERNWDRFIGTKLIEMTPTKC